VERETPRWGLRLSLGIIVVMLDLCVTGLTNEAQVEAGQPRVQGPHGLTREAEQGCAFRGGANKGGKKGERRGYRWAGDLGVVSGFCLGLGSKN
jgi:hypothetical protein